MQTFFIFIQLLQTKSGHFFTGCEKSPRFCLQSCLVRCVLRFFGGKGVDHPLCPAKKQPVGIQRTGEPHPQAGGKVAAGAGVIRLLPSLTISQETAESFVAAWRELTK